MMKYKPLYANVMLLLSICLYASCSSSEQTQVSELSPKDEVVSMSEENFRHASLQYKHLMEILPPTRFPKTYHADRNELETSGSEWWCSGFYPGTLLYLYEETGDQDLYNEALRIMEHLEEEQYNTRTHDLGFMMFCSFGNAHRINPKKEYEQILLNSAKSLASRFNPEVGAIKSWNSEDEDGFEADDFIVIIDNMMNLELLFWATEYSGDSTFYDIALVHANTTLDHHFRPDHSSYHVINYDPATGEVKEKKTAQGYSDESAWARGQAWGLYGYTVMYRATHDPKYLRKAVNIADFMLDHPNMPEDQIPYWDYNAPDIPNALRDASASTIMASALLELSEYVEQAPAQKYFQSAETVIKNLSTEGYIAEAGENGGFILKHSVGHIPAGTEIDVPVTYADYYFVEAMRRYKRYQESESARMTFHQR